MMSRTRVLFVSLAALAVTVMVSGHAVAAPENATGTRVDATSLSVGDCVTEFEWSETSLNAESAWVVPCTEPHEYEVYASHELSGSAYPGAFTLVREAHDLCVREFENFADTSHTDSIYDVFYLYPSAAAWRTGDRQVSCMIVATTGPVSESLAGAGR
ncbi:septum formation family protein [Hoyosella sp. YIM 151337]|uniref:septum formation family protein n=1 Tax=Hoyosella sp. YIM 151337 TaxID=2992742 RepID=UPI0022366581|nr:septum formation family protein [Hoyosella sp. YIM 151337]MCW4351757.1 septum formation family protein [Hoyosella sp. YIM 151337]